jgi:hypothetical protein
VPAKIDRAIRHGTRRSGVRTTQIIFADRFSRAWQEMKFLKQFQYFTVKPGGAEMNSE